MTDDLERRLSAHYRSIDRVAPARLTARVATSLEIAPVRGGRSPMRRPALAIAAAALLVAVGLGLGMRPGGFLTSPGASGMPSGSTSPSVPAISPSPSATSPQKPSPTPSASALDTRSVPPISSTPWTTIRLLPTEGGLAAAESEVAWAGGYITLGRSGEGLTLPAWVSRDGRRWVQLPIGTFGDPALAIAVPCADGVLVIGESPTGEQTIWRSRDGTTWTSMPSRQRLGDIAGTVAGNAAGAIAIAGKPSPDEVVFSADGIAWQSVPLPGGPGVSVYAVAAFGPGFVAVGAGTTGSPAAWWSGDGLLWHKAVVEPTTDAFFESVHAGRDGLVAESSSGRVPGGATFWTSRDGRTWARSKANPLGTLGPGEGVGSAIGLFQGDGNRLLGYGIRSHASVNEYWVSLDATHWTKLVLAGDALGIGDATPFLMRDGVLFDTGNASWFGSVVP